MRRRSVVSSLCGLGVLLAGCTSGERDDDTPTPAGETGTPRATVADDGPCPKDSWPVQLANRQEGPRTLAVTVTDDGGSTILSGEYDVPPRSADDHLVEPDAEVVYEETYTVEVRLDGEHALTEEYEVGCGALMILVEEDGSVGLYTMLRQD